MRKSTTRHHLNKTQRHNEWLKLYAGGATCQSIADLYGVRKQAVFTVCKKALQDARTERVELNELLVDLAVHRYNDLYRRAVEALDEAAGGREVGRAALLAAARGVVDSYVKLLGLDQPARTEVTVRVRDDVDDELHRLANLLKSNAPDGAPTDVLDAIIDETQQLPAADDQ